MDDFKGKKSTKIEAPVNEMVDAIDDFYRVSVDVDLPKSLVSSFIKKVKESTGKDLRADMGEKRLAERLVQWANENYLNIEINFNRNYSNIFYYRSNIYILICL